MVPTRIRMALHQMQWGLIIFTFIKAIQCFSCTCSLNMMQWTRSKLKCQTPFSWFSQIVWLKYSNNMQQSMLQSYQTSHSGLQVSCWTKLTTWVCLLILMRAGYTASLTWCLYDVIRFKNALIRDPSVRRTCESRIHRLKKDYKG